MRNANQFHLLQLLRNALQFSRRLHQLADENVAAHNFFFSFILMIYGEWFFLGSGSVCVDHYC